MKKLLTVLENVVRVVGIAFSFVWFVLPFLILGGVIGAIYAVGVPAIKNLTGINDATGLISVVLLEVCGMGMGFLASEGESKKVRFLALFQGAGIMFLATAPIEISIILYYLGIINEIWLAVGIILGEILWVGILEGIEANKSPYTK